MREITHRAVNSRMGYFLWLNDRIVITNVANVIANINALYSFIAPLPGPHNVGHAGVVAGRNEHLFTGVNQPPLNTNYLNRFLKQS